MVSRSDSYLALSLFLCPWVSDAQWIWYDRSILLSNERQKMCKNKSRGGFANATGTLKGVRWVEFESRPPHNLPFEKGNVIDPWNRWVPQTQDFTFKHGFSKMYNLAVNEIFLKCFRRSHLLVKLTFCYVYCFQVRTKVDPLKWPILVETANPMFEQSEHTRVPIPQSDPSVAGQSGKFEFCPVARPLRAIPVPPLPRILQTVPYIIPQQVVSGAARLSESESISSSTGGESLNPDVPEFVPIVMATSKFASQSTFNHQENNNRSKEEEERCEDDRKRMELLSSINSDKTSDSSNPTSKLNSQMAQVNGDIEPAANEVWKEVRAWTNKNKKQKNNKKNQKTKKN